MDDDERALRPERLATLAGHLDEAIGEFREWGIRIPEGTRLPVISQLLRATAERGCYPDEKGQLAVIGEAIRDAQEFIEIANVLPAEPIESVKHDLQVAVRGALTAPGSTGPHLQFQSQLWVGAMLVGPDVPVGVLSREHSGKNPDFILTNGTMKYAIEVKRPNGRLDAYNVVRKAARQIRNPEFHGGVIVVDVTDCIHSSIRLNYGCGGPELTGVTNAVTELIDDLHDQVFSEGRDLLRPGREHVFSLIGFSRSTYWDICELEHPFLSRFVATVNYWRRDHRSLRAHRARWLGELIHRGILQAGHQDQGRIELRLGASSD